VDFSTAVRSVLRQYATFSGRARRSEYWWFFLFTVVVSILTTVIDALVWGTKVEDNGPTTIITTVALLLPTLAVSVRRLHDVDHSGWFLLFGLVPIVGWIILLVVTVKDSGTDNRFGPSPKYPTPPFNPATAPPPHHATQAWGRIPPS
jgi:uncharacterized membrane protein YhaH (DUF805 family)